MMVNISFEYVTKVFRRSYYFSNIKKDASITLKDR